MHIGKVAERIQGASRLFRRRFESRLGHFLSRTQMFSEFMNLGSNQGRTLKKPILTVFSL